MTLFKVYFSKCDAVARLISSFHLLEQDGVIELKLIEDTGNPKRVPAAGVVEAEADGKCIAFDMGDRWVLSRPENVSYLSKVDAYFARDYSEHESIVTPIVFQDNPKVMPYGFNYYSSYYGNPVLKPSGKAALLKYHLRYLSGYARCFDPSYFEGHPDKKQKDIRILFMARLWDPSTIRLDSALPEDIILYRQYMKDELSSINRTRIAVMRMLKKEFGSAFFGGMIEDELTEKECPDLILPKAMVRKKAYLNRMKQSDICIGTMGLHKSIGWKMGEYVAASRAIVSEPLYYSVPGNFLEGKNYLAFTSPEICCEQVASLYSNPDRLFKMKQENYNYYTEFLEPRKQLRNALTIAGFSFPQ